MTKKNLKAYKRYKPTSTFVLSQTQIDNLSKILLKQINKEIFREKRAKIEPVLKLVGAGLLLAGTVVFPTLPQALAPFFRKDEYQAWKRFNLPYLKRTLERLEKQKLVETCEENGFQVVKITENGKKRILRYALDELAVEKPKIWNGTWWLISYDLPQNLINQREILRDYLQAWGFYPLHESVYLHAYSCFRQVEFLREYLGVGEYVRIFKVSQIENDQHFRDFFGV
ncbi:hypothetical protein HZB97_01260 [Candidatus Gottesmanbacteria bacterium]|nr:hypothetical protein [Candidatus Gottesmanbacteria bacterium]